MFNIIHLCENLRFTIQSAFIRNKQNSINILTVQVPNKCPSQNTFPLQIIKVLKHAVFQNLKHLTCAKLVHTGYANSIVFICELNALSYDTIFICQKLVRLTINYHSLFSVMSASPTYFVFLPSRQPSSTHPGNKQFF